MATPPQLILIIDKGPRSGETVEGKPKTPTRIGRVVKGNNFPIKDPGISQKHLVIQFLSDTSQWAVTDLDTSNGTLLNGAAVAPSSPTPLSDGDTIKIGESTSITVKITASETADDAPKPPPRRSGRSAKAAEPAEAKEEEPAPVPTRRRGRPAAAPLPPRAQKKVKILEPVVDEPVKKAAEAEKEEILDMAVEDSPKPAKNVKKGRGRGRGTARAPVTRVTRARASAAVEPPSDSVPIAPEALAVPELEQENLDSVPASTAPEPEQENLDSVPASTAPEPQEENLQAERSDADGSKLVNNAEAKKGGEELIDDWENMTLGQWFDRMEIVLPQMISDVADEIIADMREKARRFDEYVVSAPTL